MAGFLGYSPIHRNCSPTPRMDRKLRLAAAGMLWRVSGSLDSDVRQAIIDIEEVADGIGQPVYQRADTFGLASPSVWSSLIHATNRSIKAGLPEMVAADIVRDVVGDPLVLPMVTDSKVTFGSRTAPTLSRRHLTRDVLALARYAYSTRDFSCLPALADALEEAGCDEDGPAAPFLFHLRGEDGCPFCEGAQYVYETAALSSRRPCPACGGTGFRPSPHVRGCWAVDTILGH
jgi:hypothetical protein